MRSSTSMRVFTPSEAPLVARPVWWKLSDSTPHRQNVVMADPRLIPAAR